MGYAIFEDTMADMTWVEVENAIREGAIALLPTGVIEAHGPHLSLGTDTYSSWLFCKSARRDLEAKGIRTLIAPPCYWGINRATGAFPGSFSVRPETFKALLLDTLQCLKDWGVTHVFNIDAHGDPEHQRAIFSALEEAQATLGLNAYSLLEDYLVPIMGLTGNEPYILVTETPPVDGPMPEYADIHAGAIETGMMRTYFPDLVKAGIAKQLGSTRLTFADIPTWQHGGETARQMTPQGYFGDPAAYERDLTEVRKYFDALPRMYAEAIAGVLHCQGSSD